MLKYKNAKYKTDVLLKFYRKNTLLYINKILINGNLKKMMFYVFNECKLFLMTSRRILFLKITKGNQPEYHLAVIDP